MVLAVLFALFSSIIIFNFSDSFVCKPKAMSSRFSLSMKVKEPSVGNLARKLKRKLRTVDAITFSELYTEEFDNFLKTKASAGIYENIMKHLTKTARQLKIEFKSDFGKKAVVVRPDIIETAKSVGTFNVSIIYNCIWLFILLDYCFLKKKLDIDRSSRSSRFDRNIERWIDNCACTN
jgi:hypothetical protein